MWASSTHGCLRWIIGPPAAIRGYHLQMSADTPLLDRPVWASLSTAHAPFAVGGASARRYAPDVNLFGSACDDAMEALAALAALVPA